MKNFLFITFFAVVVFLINAEEYIINFQGQKTTKYVHKYANKDNFRMIKLDGTLQTK